MIKRGVMKRTTTTAAFIAAVVVLFAVLGAGGTYALWQDRYEVPPVTISSGSAELEVVLLGSGTVGPLFPGEANSVSLQVSNVGNSDLQVHAAAGGSSDVVTSLVDSPMCAGAAPAPPVEVTIASGETRSMCLQVLLSIDSPNGLRGQSSAVDVVLDGTAGAWTAQDQVPLNMQRGDISIGLSTWNAGLLGLTAGGVAIANTSARPLELTMEVEGGGLLNLNNTYLSSSSSCNGLLAPVELLLGSGVYDLGDLQTGGTVYVCMTSLLGLGTRQVTVTATYPASQWSVSSTSSSFRF